MRAVLDPNVVISAALSPSGAPAQVLLAWREGRFEAIASPQLVEELARALAYPKLRKRIREEDSQALASLIARGSVLRQDIDDPPRISSDPGDDYLVALAKGNEAVLVSGDRDLLALAPELPVFTPRKFLQWLGRQR